MSPLENLDAFGVSVGVMLARAAGAMRSGEYCFFFALFMRQENLRDPHTKVFPHLFCRRGCIGHGDRGK